jgi:hypothetical protein
MNLRPALDWTKLWRWFKNWLAWSQCDSEIPIGKRIVACCYRCKDHYGAHKSRSGDIW